MRGHFSFICIIPVFFALYLILTNAGSAQEGPVVGTVGEVKRAAKEITVHSPKAALLITMGDRLYVRIDGRVVIMRVTFPMQTIARCIIEPGYAGYLDRIVKGMPVYRFVKGIEKDAGEKIITEPETGSIMKAGGIEFIYIRSGIFMMGSPKGEGLQSERPQHRVELDGFWMGKYEVTQGQYQQIMGQNKSRFKGDNLPVENVTWEDARQFCIKFTQVNGADVRLPTEAEWEYACRAGTSAIYYWGDQIDGAYCWYGDNSGSKTHPVGQKKPNAWGLYDMSGNVWEWCGDWYSDSYAGHKQVINPKGPVSGSKRVLRGGAWPLNANSVRSAYRIGREPKITISSDGGFRLVMLHRIIQK